MWSLFRRRSENTRTPPQRVRRALSWFAQAAVVIVLVAAASRVAGVLRAPAVAHGAQAPLSTGRTLQGETFQLADLKGRPVLLNFWATWCAPCRHELPDLAAAARAHADVQFVGVLVDHDASAARVLSDAGVKYLNVELDSGSLARWRLEAVPSSVLLDESGRVLWARGGLIDQEDVAQVIAEHLDRREASQNERGLDGRVARATPRQRFDDLRAEGQPR